MAEYIDDLGDVYNEDEINQFATDNDTTFEDIISRNNLKQKEEDPKPGKKKPVAKKDVVATTKGTVSKSVKPSSATTTNRKIGGEVTKKNGVSTFISEWNKNSIDKQNLLLSPKIVTPKSVASDLKAKAATASKDISNDLKKVNIKTDLSILGGPAPVEEGFAQLGKTEEYKKQERIKAKKEKAAAELETEKSKLSFANAKIRNTEEYLKADNLIKKARVLPAAFERELDAETKSLLKRNGKEEERIEAAPLMYVAGGGDGGGGIRKYNFKAFEDERKQAIANLKKDGKQLSETNIVNEAALVYKAKKIEDKKYEQYAKALSEVDNYGSEVQKFFKDYKISQDKVGSIEKANIVTQKDYVSSLQAKKIEDFNRYSKELKPKDYKFTSQKEVDKQNELIANINTIVAESKDLQKYKNKLTDKEYALTNDGLSLTQEIDLLGKEWDTSTRLFNSGVRAFEKADENIVGGLAWATDMARAGFLDLYGETLDNKVGDYVAKVAKDHREYYDAKTPKKLDNSTSLGDLAFNLTDTVLQQTPMIAASVLTGGTGLVATGLIGGTGDKYLSMLEENKFGYMNEEGQIVMPDYNMLQLSLVPVAFGAAEYGTEIIGGRALDRGKDLFTKLLGKATPVEKNLMLEGVKNYNAEKAKEFAKVLLTNYAEEIPGETLNTVFGNFTDKYLLDKKDVNLLDNVPETIFDTAVVSTFFGTSPMIAGAVYKPFMPKSKVDELRENNKEVERILRGVDYESLSKEEQSIIDQRVNALKDKSTQIINGVVGMMGTTDSASLLDLDKQSRSIVDIKKQANTINNSTQLSTEQKTTLLEGLQIQFDQVNGSYNRALSKAYAQDAQFRRANSWMNRLKLNKDLKLGAAFNASVLLNEKGSKIEFKNGAELVDLVLEDTFVRQDSLGKDYTNKENIDVAAAEIEKADVANGANPYSAEQKLFTKKAVATDYVNSNGWYDPNNNTVYVNKQSSLKGKSFTTARHEFQHKVISKFANNMGNIGGALYTYVKDNYVSDNKKSFEDTKFFKRLTRYNNDLEVDLANMDEAQAQAEAVINNKLSNKEISKKQANLELQGVKNSFILAKNNISVANQEEVLTILEDSMQEGDIKLDPKTKSAVKFDASGNLILNNAQDVLAFITAYSESFSKTKKSAAVSAAIEGKVAGKLITAKPNANASNVIKDSKAAEVQAKIDKLEDQFDNDKIEYDDYTSRLSNLEKELEKAKSLSVEDVKPMAKKKESDEDAVKEIINNEKGSISSNKVQEIFESKGLAGAQDIINLFKPITKRIVDKRRDAPGFDRELLTDEVETGAGGILDLIKSYNAAKGVPLAAYINKQLPLRAIAASRRILDTDFSKDVTEEKGLMAEETVSETKEKPKYKNALESKVFDLEVVKTMASKILTNIRTLKARINEPITLNRTVTPLIAEIRDAMGKQLDIDVKSAMGGKKDGQLNKWLLKNKRYVLENMTTTWLMGLNGTGGIPQAIQKQIDGKWVNYPDWVSQKIDRETTFTDNAGRTSGVDLVRRIPNVFNNVSDEDYLGQIVGPDGNPIRGRKESLAKAVAEESAFDIINTDLNEEGEIFDALSINQQRLGYEVLNNFATTFSLQSERGNVKRSKGVIQALDEINNLPEKTKLILRGDNGNKFIKYAVGTTNPEKAETEFYKIYSADDFSSEEINTIINAVKKLLSYYDKSQAGSGYKKITSGPNEKESFAEYANRKVFNAMSKDKSIATILGVTVDSLQWNTPAQRKSAKGNMKQFHKEAIKYLKANNNMTAGQANKLFTRLFSRGFAYGKDQSMFEYQEQFYNTFLKGKAGFALSNVKKGQTITYNGEKVNLEIGGLEQKTSAPDIANYLSTGNLSDIKYSDRKKLSDASKSDLEQMMKMLFGMKKEGLITNVQLGLVFKSLGGSMASPLKMASELKYVAKLENDSKNPNDYVYEHSPPTSWVIRMAIGTITGESKMSVDDFMDKIIGSAYVTILPKSTDEAVNKIYKSTMPFYYKPGDNPLIRYFDLGFEGYAVPSLYDLSTKEKINNPIKKNEFYAKEAEVSQGAVLKSSSPIKKSKGISVFDFDDTVGLTKGNVLYTMPDGVKGKLNAEEFAKNGATMLDNGAEFDFSEFSQVVDGKPGPMVEKMKKMIGKFGPENFFILTARPQAAAVPIHNFLSSIGIDIPLDNITGLGNSKAQAKADWMVGKAAEGYNDFYFADDAPQNVEAVENALSKLNVKAKIQQAIIKRSLSTKQVLNWELDSDGHNTIFTVGGRRYYISLVPTGVISYDDKYSDTLDELIEDNDLDTEEILGVKDGSSLNLEFLDRNKGQGITDTGNAFKVLGVVANGIIDRVKDKSIETLVFTAKEPSRIKLYNALSTVFANKLGWKAYFKNGVYIITKNYNEDESTGFANQSNEVKNVLGVVDVKSQRQQNQVKFSKSMSDEFNDIIEANKGVENYKVYSDITARRRGIKKTRFDFYVSPSASDFELLLYKFMGKGTMGEDQKEFFTKALLLPYASGVDLINAARQSIKRNYKALTKSFPNIANRLEKLTPDKDFTYDQAIRVAMWSEAGIDIPGLSDRDRLKLTDLVNNDAELNAFKKGLEITGRQGKGWVMPGEYWDASTIISDLHNLTEGEGRKVFLGEFIENVETIFGKFSNGKLSGPNINKVEAVYGTNVREALDNILYRMISGKNKSIGRDKETTAWNNWVNGSTGTIMFFNTRSAALQLLGAVNFLNLRDNNPIAAAAAFANQPQYWKDFSRIWNSDKMKERRGGLKEDVAAAEIANAAAGSKNKVNAVMSYLLKIGYTPTQLADSFAIASGGAPYYRNRIKSYLKEGLSQDEAEKKAWTDFTKISDETQQSGDPRDISKQQASGAGRLLLTFQNTAMQQSRIVKKSFLDLKNGRGDAKTHMTKIVYYLAIQNIMFSALQQGIFAVAFGGSDDDDEAAKKKLAETTETKLIDIADNVLDTILRGTGFLGGTIATVKNILLKYQEEQKKEYKSDYAKVILEGANISPPIGSKLRKGYFALQHAKYDRDLIKERGWGVMQDGRVHLGPMYSVTGKVTEAITNFPMDRLVSKIENTSQALNSQNEVWQRVMIALGWSPYSIGIKNPASDQIIKDNAKEQRKEEGLIKAAETRQATKDSIKALPISERIKLKREKALERREARRKKRKMGE